MGVRGSFDSRSKSRWNPAFAGMTRLSSSLELYRNRFARHPGESRDPVWKFVGVLAFSVPAFSPDTRLLNWYLS